MSLKEKLYSFFFEEKQLTSTQRRQNLLLWTAAMVPILCMIFYYVVKPIRDRKLRDQQYELMQKMVPVDTHSYDSINRLRIQEEAVQLILESNPDLDTSRLKDPEELQKALREAVERINLQTDSILGTISHDPF